MRIMAIDLGKSKSVLCIYDSESGDHTFETIGTTVDVFAKRLADVAPERVVIETCPIAGWVGDLVRSEGIELEVANPSHEAWRWKNVKRKTDRDDALKLARMSAMNQLPTVYLPAYGTRQWRSFIGYRQSLVRRRTRIKNRIRAILRREGKEQLSGRAAWSNCQLRTLKRMAQPIDDVEMDTLWQAELHEELEQFAAVDRSIANVTWKLDELARADRRVQRLTSIPGVGNRLAEAIVSVIDDPHRFKSPKQVGAYVGLTPKQYQSGSMNRLGGISGHGDSQLRSLLVEVSWLGLRHNDWMRTVYERVAHESKSRRKIAIVAVARRLLIRCWAMMREETTWEPPPVDTTAEITAAA